MSFSKTEIINSMVVAMGGYGLINLLMLVFSIVAFLLLVLYPELSSRRLLLLPFMILSVVIVHDAASIFFALGAKTFTEKLSGLVISVLIPPTDVLALITLLITFFKTLTLTDIRVVSWMGLVSSVAHTLVSPFVVGSISYEACYDGYRC